MTMDVLIEEVARAYKNPSEGEADFNGHTRLSILQEKFHLSSLKLQKILVTAGVYEPVKSSAAYHTVERLRKEGKSAAEIIKITGFSSATVSACFPYEKALYNADKNGADVTSAAERKRRQRDREEEKRQNSLEMLQGRMTDEDFLNAVRDHEGMLFISLDNERYAIEMRNAVEGSRNSDAEDDFLWEFTVYAEGEKKTAFSEKDALSVFHNALEMLSSGQKAEPSLFNKNESLPYIYPLLVVFGIIPGDRQAFTARRNPSDLMVCDCCGRRASYRIRNYGDLVRISREISSRERMRWKESGNISSIAGEEEAYRKWWEEAARKDSSAIRSFNREGERMLCTMCVQTIFLALDDGELPAGRDPEDVSLLPLEAASAEFFSSMKEFPKGIRYRDRSGRTYEAGAWEEDCMIYLHQAVDQRGTVHSFACYMQNLSEGFRVFDAYEIHKLTKAGKIARDYTGTDYDFRTRLKERCPEDNEEDRRRIYTGFLELASKIRDALTNPSLEWSERSHPIINNISFGSWQCGLRSTGEMKIAYVEDEGRLIQGRQWSGGDYGFMIDGRIFTGEEVSLMSSTYEGWNLQYRFADPADRPLGAGEYLMPVRISDRSLVEEMSELLNLFVSDGKFISDHDRRNFGVLFEKTVLKKLRLYHESNPRGYGRLAAMHLIKRLKWVEGTDVQEEQIRQIVRM